MTLNFGLHIKGQSAAGNLLIEAPSAVDEKREVVGILIVVGGRFALVLFYRLCLGAAWSPCRPQDAWELVLNRVSECVAASPICRRSTDQTEVLTPRRLMPRQQNVWRLDLKSEVRVEIRKNRDEVQEFPVDRCCRKIFMIPSARAC